MFESSTDFDYDDDLNVKVTSQESPDCGSKRQVQDTTNEDSSRKKAKDLNVNVTSQESPECGSKRQAQDTTNEDSSRKKAKVIHPGHDLIQPESPRVVKRKFPGPAGLLLNLDNSAEKTRTDIIPCSQNSLTIFLSQPWLKMKNDYENLSNKYNIEWIKSRAVLNKLVNRKAPFLAAFIQNIDFGADTIYLKDFSGEIRGTLNKNLMEEYSDKLNIGSVIVLKQCAVLTTGVNNKNNQSLIISLNNLVCIYAKPKNSQSSDNIQIIKVQNCDLSLENDDFGDELDFKIPENFEGTILDNKVGDNTNLNLSSGGKPEKKQFKFKKPPKPISLGCNQISVISTSPEESEIWQNAFEGVDADSLFDDF